MKIGNILASIGIIIGFLGLIMLPLYNVNELPFTADSGYAKGGGWRLLAQSGVFKSYSLYLLIGGIILYLVAKILPKKYWATYKEPIEYEIKAGKKRIKKPKKTEPVP